MVIALFGVWLMEFAVERSCSNSICYGTVPAQTEYFFRNFSSAQGVPFYAPPQISVHIRNTTSWCGEAEDILRLLIRCNANLASPVNIFFAIRID